ncbi:hypothetical protein E3N88_03058 [Mikania micrantha]|uniref:Uncharacterized protein n=1 Tax=Mikania micrantha TaxID=192012 RepID=A0A5N6Q5N6_9ASTR|nr:hypothetical protein E3N88_03058 [Mikania micrantha]
MYKLTENMRLQRPNLSSQDKITISSFSSWLVAIGDGTIGTQNNKDSTDTRYVQIPEKHIIPYKENSLMALIHFIYDNDTLQHPTPTRLCGKAIICPTNEHVEEINYMIIKIAPGTAVTYASNDTIIPLAGNQGDIEVLYPPEYLNLLNFNGLPPHSLELKVNAPIILLRNLNPKDGLCNGTRLIITQLLPRIVEARKMTGKFIAIKRITIMQEIRLSELKSQQRPIPLQIRVLKKWKLSGDKEEICYLFVDKHGDGIEATVDVDPKNYFEPAIEVQSCYKVTKYVVVENRNYNPILKHEASIKIGKKAYFEQFSGEHIPRYYIGVVESNLEKVTTTAKTLRKVDLRDASNKQVQITLWPTKRHLIGDDVKRGDIVAITSTLVTQYGNLKQLESTYPTEVFVNPTFNEIQQHIQRLKAATAHSIQSTTEDTVTIKDILNQLSTTEKSVFTCKACIKEIQTYRTWFYALCSICNSKLYREVGETSYYVCKNDEDMEPKFLYCVNATIFDETATTNVVFFNQVMTDMLHITCQDLVVLHGYNDPKVPPPEIISKVGIPMTFSLTVNLIDQ